MGEHGPHDKDKIVELNLAEFNSVLDQCEKLGLKPEEFFDKDGNRTVQRWKKHKRPRVKG